MQKVESKEISSNVFLGCDRTKGWTNVFMKAGEDEYL